MYDHFLHLAGQAAATPSKRAFRRTPLRLLVRERGRGLTGDAGRISELLLDVREPSLFRLIGAVDSRLRGVMKGRGKPAFGGEASPLVPLLKLELLLDDMLTC
jgi:hypothetical protein